MSVRWCFHLYFGALPSLQSQLRPFTNVASARSFGVAEEAFRDLASLRVSSIVAPANGTISPAGSGFEAEGEAGEKMEEGPPPLDLHVQRLLPRLLKAGLQLACPLLDVCENLPASPRLGLPGFGRTIPNALRFFWHLQFFSRNG